MGRSARLTPRQLTCLFWFETTAVHRAAETYKQSSPAKRVPRLSPLAVPSLGFKKWVHSVLSTTQVTQNVILLALMFIYRLKCTNPTVRGQAGSEYRLLTVALMLGNKCEYPRLVVTPVESDRPFRRSP